MGPPGRGEDRPGRGATGLPEKRRRPVAVNERKLNAFLGQFVQDLGATVQAGLAYLPGAFQLAWPASRPSRASPRRSASDAGVSDRVRFEVAPADRFGGDRYDLVAPFDCFHDMGDSAGAAAHIRRTLADGGTWLLVEPAARDHLKDNLNPVGRLYYGFRAAKTLQPCRRGAPMTQDDFSEHRVGLDHVSFGVANRAELEKWPGAWTSSASPTAGSRTPPTARA